MEKNVRKIPYSTPTMEKEVKGKASHARELSDPVCPDFWALNTLAAVRVFIPKPSPTNKITFLAIPTLGAKPANQYLLLIRGKV